MTFSIVALDFDARQFGVGAATGGPVVGSLVPHAAPGIGAIATQGHTTNPFFGIEGLKRLASGQNAGDALAEMIAEDENSHLRQCIIVDSNGQSAHHCGSGLQSEVGAVTGPGYAIAGNLLADEQVLEAMQTAFLRHPATMLNERLLAALRAGQNAGGDRRGTRSAALKVYGAPPYPLTDLRADWSADPIAQLEAILDATRNTDYASFFNRLPKNSTDRRPTAAPSS